MIQWESQFRLQMNVLPTRQVGMEEQFKDVGKRKRYAVS